MLDRNNSLLVGLGGGGSSLTDTIVDVNPIFIPYFINTSITDIEDLNNSNNEIRNYMLISTTNGVGRNRKMGIACAETYGFGIIDTLSKFQQENIYLVASFGGGSGSAILEVLLRAISQMKEDNDFDKNIHVIGILPSIKSNEVLLNNCIETWNKVLSYSKHISSMIFVDNDSRIGEGLSQREKEIEINNNFAELFDSIFDIPLVNGQNFDSANLGNILADKGTLYFYELDEDCSSIEICLQKAKKESVLASMFKTEINTIFESNGTTKTKCGHLGLSIMDGFKFGIDNVLKLFAPKKEVYVGLNDDKNLLVLSGMLPPYDKITLISHEIESRNKENEDKNEFDLTLFMTQTSRKDENNNQNDDSINNNSTTSKKQKKQRLKKNLFKR
ncbi:hypothetical protein [Clostridium butyricum]|uniref:hypothetical protein n=1 Tax=Clostridium butyricum TaxID=1492 RepID=UPI00325B86E5